MRLRWIEVCRGYSAVRNCLLKDSLERVRFSRRQFDQMIGLTDGIGGMFQEPTASEGRR